MCKVPCLISSTAKKHRRATFLAPRVSTHSLRSSSSLGQTIKQARKGDTPPSSSGNIHQWHTGILGCWCPELMQSSLQESHTLKMQKLRDIQHHQHSLSILCSTKSTRVTVLSLNLTNLSSCLLTSVLDTQPVHIPILACLFREQYLAMQQADSEYLISDVPPPLQCWD